MVFWDPCGRGGLTDAATTTPRCGPFHCGWRGRGFNFVVAVAVARIVVGNGIVVVGIVVTVFVVVVVLLVVTTTISISIGGRDGLGRWHLFSGGGWTQWYHRWWY